MGCEKCVENYACGYSVRPEVFPEALFRVHKIELSMYIASPFTDIYYHHNPITMFEMQLYS